MARIGKSPEYKRRAGNPGKRAIRQPMRPGRAETIAPPAWLKGKHALAAWERITPDLQKLRWVAGMTADVLGRWCYHFGEWQDCADKIRKEGKVVSTPMTNWTPENPHMMQRENRHLKIQKDHESAMLSLEDRFGLSALAALRLASLQSVHGRALLPLFSDLDQAERESPPPADSPLANAAPVADAFGFLGQQRPN